MEPATMLQRFIRKAAAREMSGYGDSEFDEAVRDGRFPQPDGYLGPRSPFWTEQTIIRWQTQKIGTPKPIETRPSRRRKNAEAQAEASP
jgi:predicted DNA-binding transcriptional regulator AlpA